MIIERRDGPPSRRRARAARLRAAAHARHVASECGTLWGNGGDIAGYNNRFRNSEDGTRQSGVVVDVNPMPKRLGEPLGQAKQTAISDALGSGGLC